MKSSNSLFHSHNKYILNDSVPAQININQVQKKKILKWYSHYYIQGINRACSYNPSIRWGRAGTKTGSELLSLIGMKFKNPKCLLMLLQMKFP